VRAVQYDPAMWDHFKDAVLQRKEQVTVRNAVSIGMASAGGANDHHAVNLLKDSTHNATTTMDSLVGRATDTSEGR